MSWTPDRKEMLKRLWIEGKTSKQIAETLGGVTRNAVMGMVNRMGLIGNKAHNAIVKTNGAPRLKALKPDSPPCREHPEDVDPQPAPTIQPPADGLDGAPKETRSIREEMPAQPRKPAIPRSVRIAPPPSSHSYIDGPSVTEDDSDPDWRMAISMVEEIVGRQYSPTSAGHRTALVAIASILGGGDPRRILPGNFPEPFISRTMRGMAEKGIMAGGNTPETWLDPQLGDFNFFIDMLQVEGVITSPGPAALQSLTA